MADGNHLGMNFSVSANVQPLLYKIEDACKQINAAGNQLKGFSVGVEDSTQKMVKTAKKQRKLLSDKEHR